MEIKILWRVRAESSRRPPRHRRDTCSTAWGCRFPTARTSQDGRVIADKRLSEEFSGAPDALVDFHTVDDAERPRCAFEVLCGNQISGAPRHRRDIFSVAASARWRESQPNSLVDFHAGSRAMRRSEREWPQHRKSSPTPRRNRPSRCVTRTEMEGWTTGNLGGGTSHNMGSRIRKWSRRRTPSRRCRID